MCRIKGLLLIVLLALSTVAPAAQQCAKFKTMHEGAVLYCKSHGFWVRKNVPVQYRPQPSPDATTFWKDFDRWPSDVTYLMRDIGIQPGKPHNARDLWQRAGNVWTWLRENARADSDAYSSLTSGDDRWPSIAEFGGYFRRHREVPWAACFSKAHLFAALIGKTIPPEEEAWRSRVVVASAHHTEGGAPATASHVFVALLIGGEWFYLDPTAVHSEPFPGYDDRASIGARSLTTVDYTHPFKLKLLPGSRYYGVPLLTRRLAGSATRERPDLVVSKLKLKPGQPVQGEPVKLLVRVENRGKGSAGPFNVQWWAGENFPRPAKQWQLEGLKAQAQQTLYFEYDGYNSWYPAINTKTVVDPDNRVREENESNNNLLQEVSVRRR